MENNNIQKGINLLDKFIPKSLEFTKSLKQAEAMLEACSIAPAQIQYYLGKLKHHNKSFAGFYCNQDDKNRRDIFEALEVYCERGKLPVDQAERFYLRLEFQQGKKNEWEYEPFEALLIHKFCLMAYNKNPEYFLLNELNRQDILNIFQKTRLKNFGSYDVWAKFWVYLTKSGYNSAKTAIVNYLLNVPRLKVNN